MPRSKLFGAFIAALVFASFAALPAAASATGGFVAGKYPAAVTGGEAKVSLGFPGAGFSETCNAPPFEALLKGPARSILPTYTGKGTECLGSSNPVEMNGCRFEFHRDTNTTDIGPSGCGPVKAWTSFCGVILIYPKTGMATTFENVGTGANAYVKIKLQGEHLKYQVNEGFGCNRGTFEDGSLYVSEQPWIVRAFEGKTETPPYLLGNQVGISTVSEAPGIGIFMDAKGLDAAEFPVSVTAEPATGSTFNLIHGRLSNGTEKWHVDCATATVGSDPLQEPLAQPSLTAVAGCTSDLGSIAINMHSCSYVLGSQVEISCSKAGDSIEINVVKGACVISLPAQVINKEAPQFKNEGEGSGANITVNMTGSGEKDTATGFGCSISGVAASSESGTTNASLRFKGRQPWTN
jgi:hypothetical protein